MHDSNTLTPRTVRVLILSVIAQISVINAAFAGTKPSPATLFFATSPGQTAMDQDDAGGNPFATALVDAFRLPKLDVVDLPRLLTELTRKHSDDAQFADVEQKTPLPDFRLIPQRSGEKRIALVFVVAHYDEFGVLPGVVFDANRITKALRQAGFDARISMDFDLATGRETLRKFSHESETAEIAVIYSTGHGVAVGGQTYLLPKDFPRRHASSMVSSRALPVDELASALHAASANLLFFGGCRNNPWQ